MFRPKGAFRREFGYFEFSVAIAALKNHAKRSHTFVYCSRYCVIFCLALTAQKASEMFRPKGAIRREFGYFEFSVAIGGLLGRELGEVIAGDQ